MVARSWRSARAAIWSQALQRTLNARIKPSPGIGTDGDFGPETENAVKNFQKQKKAQGDRHRRRRDVESARADWLWKKNQRRSRLW